LKDEENDITTLIGKQLAGETSTEEQQLVDTWCKASVENQQYFNHLKTIFDKASLVSDTSIYNEDVAWKKVQHKLHASKQKFTFTYQHLRIAASLLLLCAVGIWLSQRILTPVVTAELASTTTIVNDSLPDGTQIVLNKQSALSVSYNVRNNSGRIKLKGEANFDIKHDPEKELIVEVEEVFIRDIGTSFNVKAYAESNTVEVTVQQGEVQFYTENNSGLFIKAGEKGVYNKLLKKFLIEQPDTNVLSYKTKSFVFEEVDLKTVVDQLNAIYEKKIKISENLKTCLVTVNFDNEEIETIAEILAETLNLKISTSESEITLEGEGCE
jgi:transmembrane sensor